MSIEHQSTTLPRWPAFVSRAAIAIALALAMIATTATPAFAADPYPEYEGEEWPILIQTGFELLPNLEFSSDRPSVTGDLSLDARIWGIAIGRGYTLQPSAASGSLVSHDGFLMQSATAAAWADLEAAAAAAGHDVEIVSAYRSIADQRSLFQSELVGTTDAAINRALDTHAPPGASRHHSGYSLDIRVEGGTIGGFGDSAAFDWISADNYRMAKQHGFVPSYPEGAPHQGPQPEPWEFVYVGSDLILGGDELLFYRDDGLFRFYDVRANATLPSPLLAGDGYTTGWSAITGVDLDGLGQDELLFYRGDGLYRFYDVRSNASLGSPILGGDGYTTGWSSITAVDLEGDGDDELLFYRDDGLYRFYDVRSNGSLGSPILEGDGYTSGWTSITAVDLEGDGDDELLFYRDDGLYRFYDVRSNASLGSPILEGDEYTTGWSSISGLDLEGDAEDELMFYRDDGLYRFYDVRSDGTLPSPMLSGDEYTSGWRSITAVELGLR